MYKFLMPFFVVVTWVLFVFADDKSASEEVSQFVVNHKTVLQDQGSWVIDYELTSKSSTGIVIIPSEITAQISSNLKDGFSNSSIPGHSLPRAGVIKVSNSVGFTDFGPAYQDDDGLEFQNVSFVFSNTTQS